MIIMINGRPPHTFQDRPPESERKIIEALEEAEGTFSEVLTRVDVSKATFSTRLQELEEKGKVTRYYDSGEIIIRLTDEAATPIEKTLRELDRVRDRATLDLERGRELFSEDIVKTLNQLAAYELTTRKSKIKEIRGTYLLKALARYYVERFFIRAFAEVPQVRDAHKNLIFRLFELFPHDKKMFNFSDFESFYEENKDNEEVLPILSKARETQSVDQLDEILAWIRPLLEPVKIVNKSRPKEIKNVIWLSSSNFASSLFQSQVKTYLAALLENWYLKKKEGGEE